MVSALEVVSSVNLEGIPTLMCPGMMVVAATVWIRASIAYIICDLCQVTVDLEVRLFVSLSRHCCQFLFL
jgi:hypothetical protein